MATLLHRRLELVQQLYQQDDRPWIIAFSGGKDSTAVLQLVWIAIRGISQARRAKSVDIAYVDTGMEYPAYVQQLTETFARINAATKQQLMPFRVHILRPELRHRYFVAVVGRGYAPPTHWFRWCTKDMRIRPMSRHIKSYLSQHGKVVIVLGLRRAESAARAAILEKYSNGACFQGTYGSLSGATAFTPIEDFRTEEVWQFLMQNPCPWGDGNRQLAKLYSLTSGGECPAHSLGEGVGRTCGGSRFGCWTCTVVRKDHTGQALADQDERYEPLLEFRNWLAEMRYDRSRRWKVRRNGAPGPGPLTLATRREVLTRLMRIQRETGFELLTEHEVVEIQKLWVIDGDRKSSAITIWKGRT